MEDLSGEPFLFIFVVKVDFHSVENQVKGFGGIIGEFFEGDGFLSGGSDLELGGESVFVFAFVFDDTFHDFDVKGASIFAEASRVEGGQTNRGVGGIS